MLIIVLIQHRGIYMIRTIFDVFIRFLEINFDSFESFCSVVVVLVFFVWLVLFLLDSYWNSGGTQIFWGGDLGGLARLNLFLFSLATVAVESMGLEFNLFEEVIILKLLIRLVMLHSCTDVVLLSFFNTSFHDYVVLKVIILLVIQHFVCCTFIRAPS